MPSDLTAVAIVAAFNEADIIGIVVSDLIEQGIQVYLLDDGSTDDTAAVVERFVGRGVIAIERLPAGAVGGDGSDGLRNPFDWERILRRKSELAASIQADWFIHHDADEFRESPWPGMTLQQAIRRVDRLGYNAIDFASFDFRPTGEIFRCGDDPREVFHYYAINPHDRLQIRCWKKGGAPVDLASSGGHEARFPDRAVFPLRFILRHYPIRGQAHGERKVFVERKGRFLPSERARGWHVQYEGFQPGDQFVHEASTLKRYDPEAVAIELVLAHRGVEELVEELAAAEHRAGRLETQLADRERGIAWLREANAEYERGIAWLREANAEYERGIAWLREANAEYERGIAWLREVNAEYERGIAWPREVNAEYQRGIAWLREVVGSFQDASVEQQRGIGWLRESLAQRERELADASGRLESLTAELEALRSAALPSSRLASLWSILCRKRPPRARTTKALE